MPDFCEKCNSDTVVCQECGRIVCSKEHDVKWMIVKRSKREGNVCKECQSSYWYQNLQNHQPKPGDTGYDLMC